MNGPEPESVSLLHRTNFILLADCENRRIYRLASRNLALGVYNAADQGFIGVREKFSNRFLFTEHHWDLGAEGFGTVKPWQALELLPAEIELREAEDIDRKTHRLLSRDERGWYYADTGEHDPAIVAAWRSHKPLLSYLEGRLVELGLRPAPIA
jgi:hypothetical protein